MTVALLDGDCRLVMPALGPFDMIVADPPYEDTSLDWDKLVVGWEAVAAQCLKPSGSLWVFGSLRMFMRTADRYVAAGLRLAQDVVWEKHNGSGFQNDRFKRVHEHAVQFYRADSPWSGIYNDVQTTPDALRKTIKRRKSRPSQMGAIGNTSYESVDGGPRIMRSVIAMRSMHGRAIHDTEKPAALIEILIRTSCPAGGLVGDFFAGSGAAGEAAALTGRNYIGVELKEQVAQQARQRLSGHLFAGAP